MKYGQPAPEASQRTIVREQILKSTILKLEACQDEVKGIAVRRGMLATTGYVANTDVMKSRLEKKATQVFGKALKRVQDIVRPMYLSTTSDVSGLQSLTHAMVISELEGMIIGSACMHMITRSFEQLDDHRPQVVRAHFCGIISVLFSTNRVIIVQPGPVMAALVDAQPEADSRLALVDNAKLQWKRHVRDWAGSLLRQCEYVFFGTRTHAYYQLLASRTKTKPKMFAPPTMDVDGLYDEFIHMPEVFASVYMASLMTNSDPINVALEEPEQQQQQCSLGSSCSASTTGSTPSPTTSTCLSYPCTIRRGRQSARTRQ